MQNVDKTKENKILNIIQMPHLKGFESQNYSKPILFF